MHALLVVVRIPFFFIASLSFLKDADNLE